MRYLLSPFDVELVDATSFLADYPADIRNGWQLKSYAMLHSRFEEVLFLDADQVPVRDPAAAFDFPEYRESGAVFWPDIHDLSAHNPIWAMTGLPAETCPSWESGQMLVDKRRHLAALRVALYLNERADLVYSTLYGGQGHLPDRLAFHRRRRCDDPLSPIYRRPGADSARLRGRAVVPASHRFEVELSFQPVQARWLRPHGRLPGLSRRTAPLMERTPILRSRSQRSGVRRGGAACAGSPDPADSCLATAS